MWLVSIDERWGLQRHSQQLLDELLIFVIIVSIRIVIIIAACICITQEISIRERIPYDKKQGKIVRYGSVWIWETWTRAKMTLKIEISHRLVSCVGFVLKLRLYIVLQYLLWLDVLSS